MQHVFKKIWQQNVQKVLVYFSLKNNNKKNTLLFWCLVDFFASKINDE